MPALPAALQRAVAEGRAAWPELDVPDDAFADFLLERAEGSDLAALHAADLYLACACASGDARAMATFDRAFLKPLEKMVLGVVGADHLAAEVVQTLRARLLGEEEGRRRITEYRGRGRLLAWVRVAAARLASNVRRDERTRGRLEPLPPAPPLPIEDAVIRARYGDAFNDAFRRAFRALPAEHRLILRLHFADGLTFDQVAAALDISRATVGRRMLVARTGLRDETLRILGAEMKATPEELESVLAALGSHLDVSLGALVTAA